MRNSWRNRLLIIGIDEGRWGPSRLVKALSDAGFSVAALCSDKNPLFHSAALEQKFTLKASKSWRVMAKHVLSAIKAFKPDFIIPADELVLVLLQHMSLKMKLGGGGSLVAQCLRSSLDRQETWSKKLFKNETRLLAESLGVPTPQSAGFTSVTGAKNAAAELGFPVYLKKSFAWAGAGNILCNSEADVARAYQTLRERNSLPFKLIKKLIGRDWYPANSPMEAQKSITGESVMYNVVAYEGKVLAGFYAERRAVSHVGGPSTSVTISENQECRNYCEKLIAGLNATGFIAFDFLRSTQDGRHYLLECNPRPNQIFHLGAELGVDCCGAFADAMKGNISVKPAAREKRSFALYPQCMFAGTYDVKNDDETLDIPRSDPSLLAFMKARIDGLKVLEA